MEFLCHLNKFDATKNIDVFDKVEWQIIKNMFFKDGEHFQEQFKHFFFDKSVLFQYLGAHFS